jgi:hypothetical protein
MRKQPLDPANRMRYKSWLSLNARETPARLGRRADPSRILGNVQNVFGPGKR